MMDAARDADGLQSEVRRLPQRVRRSLLPVEKISAEQFWIEKRLRQAASHDRIAKGEIPQSALFTFSKAQLRGAQFRWPEGGFSAQEDDGDRGERSASALQR